MARKIVADAGRNLKVIDIKIVEGSRDEQIRQRFIGATDLEEEVRFYRLDLSVAQTTCLNGVIDNILYRAFWGVVPNIALGIYHPVKHEKGLILIPSPQGLARRKVTRAESTNTTGLDFLMTQAIILCKLRWIQEI